jgi:hypothetical protein
MDFDLKKAARLQRLHGLAHKVRQVAIERSADLDGWRVSHLLRDATTPAEADEAERQLRIWESRTRSSPTPAPAAATSHNIRRTSPLAIPDPEF